MARIPYFASWGLSEYNASQTVKLTTPLRILPSQWGAREDPLTTIRITDTV